MNRFPIDTIVMVNGINEPGFVLGYHGNTDYIIGWNRQPTMQAGYPSFKGLASVVYHDAVTKAEIDVMPVQSINTSGL